MEKKKCLIVWMIALLIPAGMFAQEKRDSIPPLKIDSVPVIPPVEDLLNPEAPKLENQVPNFPSQSLMDQWRKPDSSYRVRFTEADLFNPYLYMQDYSAAGPLWVGHRQAIVGSGSFNSLPYLGAVANANISYVRFVNSDFQYRVGVNASKYAFGRDAGQDFGLSGSMMYRLSDNVALNAFGNYYLSNNFYSLATMPFMQSSNYGGYATWDMSDRFGANLGVQRQFNPYMGMWETIPIVMPYINIGGQKLGIDFGGLIKQGIENMMNKEKLNNMINIQPGGGGGGGPALPAGAVTIKPVR